MPDLEERLRDALHEDATRARLVNPDGPADPNARSLTASHDRRRAPRWVAAGAVAATVVLAVAGASVLLDDDPVVDTVPGVTAGPTVVTGDGGCPFGIAGDPIVMHPGPAGGETPRFDTEAGQGVAHTELGSQVAEIHVPGVSGRSDAWRDETIELERGTASVWLDGPPSGPDDRPFVQVRYFPVTQEPCSSFTVTVDGGSEAANRQAAVDMADRILLPSELEDVDLAGAEGGDDDRPMSIADVMGVEELEPGTYFIDPDGDPSTGVRVLYDVAEEGWEPWLGAARITDGPHTNLTITTVTNVVSDACRDHSPADPPVGPTVDDLATALSQLAPFEVTAPSSDVTLFGYEGKHLELTVPDGPFTECTAEEALYSWIAPVLADGYHGYNGPEPGLTEEFWILDVDGTRLVIETNTSPDASAEAVAERQAIFDSIRIVP